MPFLLVSGSVQGTHFSINRRVCNVSIYLLHLLFSSWIRSAISRILLHPLEIASKMELYTEGSLNSILKSVWGSSFKKVPSVSRLFFIFSSSEISEENASRCHWRIRFCQKRKLINNQYQFFVWNFSCNIFKCSFPILKRRYKRAFEKCLHHLGKVQKIQRIILLCAEKNRALCLPANSLKQPPRCQIISAVNKIYCLQ